MNFESILRNFFYNKTINYMIRSIMRPFAKNINEKYQFPVNGKFKVVGKKVKSFIMVTNPTNAVSKILFWKNVEGFEYESSKVFMHLIKDCNLFLDIGSNIGYYSLLASSITNKRIEIHAFEPIPSIFTFLEKNILINGFNNIRPWRLALSNEKCVSNFYAVINQKYKNYPQLTGDGSLRNSSLTNDNIKSYKVNVDTLDNFASGQLYGKIIDIIKIDTEGNEHRVLLGSQNVLSIHRPIIQCEILKNQIEIELEQVLNSHNYLFFRSTNLGLLNVSTFLNNKSDFLNYYLVPKEKLHIIKSFVIN